MTLLAEVLSGRMSSNIARRRSRASQAQRAGNQADENWGSRGCSWGKGDKTRAEVHARGARGSQGPGRLGASSWHPIQAHSPLLQVSFAGLHQHHRQCCFLNYYSNSETPRDDALTMPGSTKNHRLLLYIQSFETFCFSNNFQYLLSL